MALISHDRLQQAKGLYKHLRSIGNLALNALLPPQCLSCRALVEAPDLLCPSCWTAVSFIDGPVCDCCGTPFDYEIGTGTMCIACLRKRPSYTRGRSVFRYDDASRALILGFKHADRTERVRAFGRWMARIGGDLCADADIIAPVPLHWRRLISRRYNQSALLSQALAKELSLPFVPDLLYRIRATPTQGRLKAAERRDNVRGAFAVNKRFLERIKGANVVLVDDVLTTGATVEFCTRTLLKAGAVRVDILTLARVVRPMVIGI